MIGGTHTLCGRGMFGVIGAGLVGRPGSFRLLSLVARDWKVGAWGRSRRQRVGIVALGVTEKWNRSPSLQLKMLEKRSKLGSK